MTVLKCLAAVAVLALSAQIAMACDDYPEEMTLAAAQEEARQATEVARSQASQATDPQTAGLALPTDVASVPESSPQAEAPGAVQR